MHEADWLSQFRAVLCHMEYGVFLFFAACVFLSTIFIYLLLPECKGLHVEEVYEVFQKHWFWKRYPAPNRPESLDDGLKDVPVKTVT